MKINVPEGISLPLAVWCLYDCYDHGTTDNYISATSLLNSPKQFVLGRRVTEDTLNITDLVPARRGTAIHDSIETAWKNNLQSSLSRLGITEEFQVNPQVVDPKANQVFMEQRVTKEFNGWIIGGKFDMILNGTIHDFKSTSVYTYKFKSKVEDYIFQCSVYAWLNQDKVTNTKFAIDYIFTDWKQSQAETDEEYPKYPIITEFYDLIPPAELENILAEKLNSFSSYLNVTDEIELPECTDKELWRSDPVFKYYQSGDTSKRCTKSFTSIVEANAYQASKGKGVVVEVKGEPRKCKYCKAYPICKQRLQYFPE